MNFVLCNIFYFIETRERKPKYANVWTGEVTCCARLKIRIPFSHLGFSYRKNHVTERIRKRLVSRSMQLR